METLNGIEDIGGPDTQSGFSVIQEMFSVRDAVDRIFAADSADF